MSAGRIQYEARKRSNYWDFYAQYLHLNHQSLLYSIFKCIHPTHVVVGPVHSKCKNILVSILVCNPKKKTTHAYAPERTELKLLVSRCSSDKNYNTLLKQWYCVHRLCVFAAFSQFSVVSNSVCSQCQRWSQYITSNGDSALHHISILLFFSHLCCWLTSSVRFVEPVVGVLLRPRDSLKRVTCAFMCQWRAHMWLLHTAPGDVTAAHCGEDLLPCLHVCLYLRGRSDWLMVNVCRVDHAIEARQEWRGSSFLDWLFQGVPIPGALIQCERNGVYDCTSALLIRRFNSH